MASLGVGRLGVGSWPRASYCVEAVGALRCGFRICHTGKFERRHCRVGRIDGARVARARWIKRGCGAARINRTRRKGRGHSRSGRVGGWSRRLRLRTCRRDNRDRYRHYNEYSHGHPILNELCLIVQMAHDRQTFKGRRAIGGRAGSRHTFIDPPEVHLLLNP